MTVYGPGIDPSKNPSPYGALSEPPPEEVERILQESAEIHSCFTTDWVPPWMRAGRDPKAAALDRALAAAKPIRAARQGLPSIARGSGASHCRTMPTTTEDDPVVPRFSVKLAVLIGHLLVTLPVVAIILIPSLYALPRIHLGAIGVSLIATGIAWLWWSWTVPQWRDWAIGAGANPNELQRLAQFTGLVWREGSWLSKTEIRRRKSK